MNKLNKRKRKQLKFQINGKTIKSQKKEFNKVDNKSYFYIISHNYIYFQKMEVRR